MSTKKLKTTPPPGRLLHARKPAHMEAIAHLNKLTPLKAEARPFPKRIQHSALCPEGHEELWKPLGQLKRLLTRQFRQDFWNEINAAGTDQAKHDLMQDFLPEALDLLDLIPSQPDLAALWTLAHCRGAKFKLVDGLAVVKIGPQTFCLEQDLSCLTQAPDTWSDLDTYESVQTYATIEKRNPQYKVYLAYLVRHYKRGLADIPWHNIKCADAAPVGMARPLKRRVISPDTLVKWLNHSEQPQGLLKARNLLKSIRYFDNTLSTYASTKKYPGDGVRFLIVYRYTQYYNQQKGITC